MKIYHIWRLKDMDKVILHSDINSCYASIELLHHPELRGKPLAVGGDPEARHGIVPVSYTHLQNKYSDTPYCKL